MRLSERGMINNCNICWFLFSLFITVTAGFSCLGQDRWSPPLRSHQQPCGCASSLPPGTDSHIPTGVTQSEHSSRRLSAPVDLMPPTQRVLRRNFPEGNAGRLERRGSERECVRMCVWVPACVCVCLHAWVVVAEVQGSDAGEVQEDQTTESLQDVVRKKIWGTRNLWSLWNKGERIKIVEL